MPGGGAALIRLVAAARAAGAHDPIDDCRDWPGRPKRAPSIGGASWLGLLPSVDVMKASVDDLVAMMPERAGADRD